MNEDKMKKKLEKYNKYKLVLLAFGIFFLLGTIVFSILFIFVYDIPILNRKYTIANIEDQYIYNYRSRGEVHYDMKINYMVEGITYTEILNYDDDLLKLINAKKIIVFYDEEEPNKVGTDFMVFYLIGGTLLLFFFSYYFNEKERKLIQESNSAISQN